MKRRSKKPIISQQELKRILHYDPKTGVFTWKEHRNREAREGQIAGSVKDGRCVIITIDRRHYPASQLAWLYMEGYIPPFPEFEIDHVNRNSLDNRWKNLRILTHSENNRNTGNPKDNTSGVKGVYWHKSGKKWMAYIYNNRSCNLGIYEDFADAVCARLAAEQCLGWIGCYSNTPAFLYVKKYILNR